MSPAADPPVGEDRSHTDATGQDGFTLLELLVAMTVLLVGILGLGMGFDSARKLTSPSGRSRACKAFPTASSA
jgi:prepilin-type N-terminal cleavage/methylation domain-containing protein